MQIHEVSEDAKGVTVLSEPPKFEEKGIAAYEWSQDGKRCALWNVSSDSFKIVTPSQDGNAWDRASITLGGRIVKSAKWSNTGDYLVIQTRYKDAHDSNVFVYCYLPSDADAGADAYGWTCLLDFSAKPSVETGLVSLCFAASDKCLLRLTSKAVIAYDFRKELKRAEEHCRYEAEGIAEVAAAPARADGATVIAVFCKGTKGRAAMIKVLSIHMGAKTFKETATHSWLGSQECELHWSACGLYLAAKTSLPIDKENKSYYGRSALHIITASKTIDHSPKSTATANASSPTSSTSPPFFPGTSTSVPTQSQPQSQTQIAQSPPRVEAVVPLDKGPVSAFLWNPNPLPSHSSQYLVAYGSNPAHVDIGDAKKGRLLLRLTNPDEKRNFFAISPCGSFALVAGFGNLPGDTNVWKLREIDNRRCEAPSTSSNVANTSLVTCTASIKLRYTVTCGFSPDSYYILSSTTTPRLRVDNGFKLIHTNGTVVYAQPIEELYAVSWRPLPDVTPRLAPKVSIPAPDVNTASEEPLIFKSQALFASPSPAASAAEKEPARARHAIALTAGGALPTPVAAGEQKKTKRGGSKKGKKKNGEAKAVDAEAEAEADAPEFVIEEPTF